MVLQQGSGLIDKLFWRVAGERGLRHCFRAMQSGKRRFYLSLCGTLERQRSGGQKNARPPVSLRCPTCDGSEMKRRGWKKSGPVLEAWSSI